MVSSSARASLVLVFCCSLWGFSFPLMKALSQVGQREVPAASTFFLASLCIALRFTVSAGVMALVLGRRLGALTRLESLQGVGIGAFGGLGLVLQMDGVAYTLASTSAFLTQGYVVLIPLWVGLTTRRWPGMSVLGACVLAVLGAGLLGWQGGAGGGVHFGRGEWETLLGSVLFAAQILWLERPIFAGNDSRRVSVVMFTTMAVTVWPIVVSSALGAGIQPMLAAYASPVSWGILAALTLFCTLVTFPLVNEWQPKIPATRAGLLYCTEPVFASLVSLWFPGLLAGWTGVVYPDETLTLNLLLGGGLILAANLLLLWRPLSAPKV